MAHRRGGRDGGPWSGPPAACASSAVRAARSRSASCFLRDGLHSLCGRGLMSLWEGLPLRHRAFLEARPPPARPPYAAAGSRRAGRGHKSVIGPA
ncbi:hypothetical protein GLE_2074 [Lysobacter enzymogenes]|uniref:Uncharacterized protein n=1 Tax=Lysobacter enzymogenes TaxID=69 RepID=A0A0S2DG21_LYSEN|nr:hypothetical protein GLE_2074 [Lysobacter enzymogenes]